MKGVSVCQKKENVKGDDSYPLVACGGKQRQEPLCIKLFKNKLRNCRHWQKSGHYDDKSLRYCIKKMK